MKNLDELINSVLAEAKEQENRRKEYISLVHGLIEGTERTDVESGCIWRISFRWYSDNMGGEMISFSSNICGRTNGITAYDKEQLEKANAEIDRCINFLLDCGEGATDNFIEHLSKIAIPQFLLSRYPQNYEIKRNLYSAMYKGRK